jgi:hypothetical protein
MEHNVGVKCGWDRYHQEKKRGSGVVRFDQETAHDVEGIGRIRPNQRLMVLTVKGAVTLKPC